MKCQLLIIFAVLINFSKLEEDNLKDTTQIEGKVYEQCIYDNI